MKVVFLVPAARFRRNIFHRIGSAFYGQSNNITGPLILGKILKDAGHDVEVYEELYENINYSRFTDVDVLGIYTMTSNSIRAYELADYLRNKKVIIGGMHASTRPKEAAEHADHVVVGEAENVIQNVVEGRVDSKIIKAVPVKNLDNVPFPDYTLLKTPHRAANIMTTRGCPFMCSFCTTSRIFYPYRSRSVENVIEELRMYKKMGFKYVNFEDDNLTADKERTKQLLKRMIDENLTFKETFFFGRKELAEDDELIDLLSRANLKRVLIGFETFNQEGLDSIDKHQQVTDIEQLKEYTDKLNRHGIKIISSLVLGLDSDTKEDMRKAIQFCKDINSYQLQPAILTPFPGTPVYEKYISEGRILTSNWQFYDMMNVVYKPQNMSALELEGEFFRAIKKFYSFTGAIQMMHIFGLNAGLRRLGLWAAGLTAKFFFEKVLKSLQQEKPLHVQQLVVKLLSRKTSPQSQNRTTEIPWLSG